MRTVAPTVPPNLTIVDSSPSTQGVLTVGANPVSTVGSETGCSASYWRTSMLEMVGDSGDSTAVQLPSSSTRVVVIGMPRASSTLTVAPGVPVPFKGVPGMRFDGGLDSTAGDVSAT